MDHHLSLPSEDAYDRGYDACLAGKLRRDNPYELQDDNYIDWANGWEDANDDVAEGLVKKSP